MQCVYAFRTSSTHYENPAVSVHKHNIVETYRNQHAPKVLKRENGNDAPMAAMTSLVTGCDTF
jgi:hypothetical protein